MGRAVFAFLLSIAFAVPAFAAPGALPVVQRKLAQKSKVIDIAIAYPQTGDKKIDADLLATVNEIAASFRREAAAAHDSQEPAYTLDVSYTIARNDAKLFAVVFNDEWDFRGAHPNLEIVTVNYFRDGSWRVYLPELFDGARGVARISQLATADLDKRLLAGPEPVSDKDWIARGADAHWANFKAFVLLPDALEIEFPPYAVASYAAGPQTARVSLARLKDVMRPDPRAPVASFDCARAATADEHAICSDVELARLDREVSETWANELRNENDPDRKVKLKTGQVAWLHNRAAACNTGDRVACLKGLYRARLDALERDE
jgi:uncharacterized protein YecT (DUF1311 family)